MMYDPLLISLPVADRVRAGHTSSSSGTGPRRSKSGAPPARPGKAHPIRGRAGRSDRSASEGVVRDLIDAMPDAFDD